MAKRPIVTLPHSVLRKRADAVLPEEIPSAKIQRLISDMKETLAAAPDGVGLAAPQVGASVRIFLVSDEAQAIDAAAAARDGEAAPDAKKWKHAVFINPMVRKRSQAKRTLAEGCLSVPGKFGEVARAEKVYLKWYDGEGRKHARGFTKFFARVIQHEMDHLDGMLIVDRAKKLFPVAIDK